MAKRGRPPKLTEANLPEMVEMLAHGCTLTEIADHLGYCDHSTFLRAVSRNPTFATAMKRGRELAHDHNLAQQNSIRAEGRSLVSKSLRRAHAYMDGQPVEESEQADALMQKLIPRFGEVIPSDADDGKKANRVIEVSVRLVDPDGSSETRTMRAEESSE